MLPNRRPAVNLPFVLLTALAISFGTAQSASIAGAAAPSPTTTSAAPATDDWDTTSPECVGIDPKPVETLLRQTRNGSYKNIHAILVARDGKLVVEEYFEGHGEDGIQHKYDLNTLHEMHSATKSVNSILVGIAIDQQLIPGVNATVSSLLPELSDLFTSGGKKSIQLKHLLSMTAGLAWNEEEIPYSDGRNDHVRMNASADPVRYVFERPMVAIPDTKFRYNSGISIALGEIVRRVSGTPPDKFAERYLFAPLGIMDYHWLKYSNGVVQTGGGLWLRPRDMAKIGQLMLNEGAWNGQQIVSRHWIRDSVTQHAPDRAYGYQWWLGKLPAGRKAVFSFGAQGRGGQFIIVFPELKMVTVFTGWNDGNGLGEQPFDMLQRYLLPAAGEGAR